MKKDLIKKGKKITENLLKKMGFVVQVEEITINDSSGVNIISQDSSLLIGRGGENLKSLQHIIKILIYRENDSQSPVKFVVDVGGYRQKQLERLKWFVKCAIEKVSKSGRPELLRPMSAFERKIVHLELTDHPKFTTESIGEEPNRRIVVKIKK